MRGPGTRAANGWTWGAALFAALFWLFDLAVLRAGTPDRLDDSWEYGAVARALLAGQGFRTPVIHPPLWTLRDAAGHVPVLVHGPVLPVLIAPLVAVFGPRVLDQLAWLAALFALLAAVAVARMGARLLSPAVGAAAAALLTVAAPTLRAVHHDVALPLGAWLLVLALDQLLRARPRAVRAGLLLGLGALVRPEFLYALPLLAYFARPAAWRLAACAVLPLLPWMWHAWANAGSPLFNLSSYLLIGYWGHYPGISVLREFALPPRAWPAALAAALPGLPHKWMLAFPHAVKRALCVPSGSTGWLALVGVAGAAQDVAARRLVAAAVLLALIPLAIMTVTLPDPRYLVPFLPLFALGVARGASGLSEWLPRWARRPRTWCGLLVLLVLPSTGPALNDAWHEARTARAELASERAALATLAAAHPPERGRPMFSDTPDFVAWTLGRPAVWVTRREYFTLARAETAAVASAGRPLRSVRDALWFHDAEGRGPAVDTDPAGGPGADSLAISR